MLKFFLALLLYICSYIAAAIEPDALVLESWVSTGPGTFQWSSTAAKREQNSSCIEYINTGTSLDSQAWSTQLRSPDFALAPELLYTACLWVRSPDPAKLSDNGFVPFNLLTADTYDMLTTRQIMVSSVWSQVCLIDFSPSAPCIAYLTLDLGRTSGAAVHFADFTLRARPDTDTAVREAVQPAAVQDRIERVRKGDLTFAFVNGSTGQPLAGVSFERLEVELIRHDFPFGTAVEWDDVPDGKLEWYLGAVARHFNALVPAWSLKWPAYEPRRGFRGYRRDRVLQQHVAWAREQGFVLTRGHTLEWPNASPQFANHWSRQGGCEAYRTALKERITREVIEFRGTFQHYDVFAEVLHERHLLGSCPGMWPSVLYDGFRWAHQADPDAVLCLTDYGLATTDDVWPFLQLVRGMQQQRVPVSCIGVQAYIPTSHRPTPRSMLPRLDALAATGLPLVVTELGFYTSIAPATGPVYDGTDEELAALYGEYVPFLYSLTYVEAVMVWNMWDETSWIRNGGIYRADGSPKTAATALYDMWHATWTTRVPARHVSLPAGRHTVRGFYGKYTWRAVLAGGQEAGGEVEFPAAAGEQQTVVLQL